MSQNKQEIDVGEDIKESLSTNRDRFPAAACEAKERYPNEPSRQQLRLLRERLDRVTDLREGGYIDAEAFKSDLEVLA